MRKELRIGGFGGQGVILAGIILGKAACLFDKNEAVQTQSYGPEARGGASKCEVVISDEKIDYPKVQSPDILVAMSHEALLKYIVDLKDNGILIVDPGTTTIEDVQDFIDEHNIKMLRQPKLQWMILALKLWLILLWLELLQKLLELYLKMQLLNQLKLVFLQELKIKT